MMASLDELELFSKKASEAEFELKVLTEEVELLRKALAPKPAISQETEQTKSLVNSLMAENNKLKYRLNIIKRAWEAETSKRAKPSEGMHSILELVTSLFKVAIFKAYPTFTLDTISVTASKDPKFADYQCNSSMQISKLLKNNGSPTAPKIVAENIVGNLPSSEIISKIDVAGAGFINIALNKEFVSKRIGSLVSSGVQPPEVQKKKVIVDFSSPNIAKEMHVGHLRSTIIGDSICKLLEFLGHDVLRLNHVGDWGTQFGMLIALLQERMPSHSTSAPPIGDLQQFYKESKKRFDEDMAFRSVAYSCVVKLQAKDPEITKAWNLICDVSRKEFQNIYNRLNVTLTERGESFYQEAMQETVSGLDSKGFLKVEEGSKVMFGNGKVPLRIVKSDGGYTYDTSDLAALRYRIQQDKAEWIVYVTDLGQATHFETIFECATTAGYLDAAKVRVDHVGFGVVLGEDKKKFKTRQGDTVRLVDLLDEGLDRALNKLKEKEREKVLNADELKRAQEAVAYGCIKYADLAHNRTNDYVFSFDRMLEDKGNTAAYLLYQYTRISSIARNANVTKEALRAATETTLLTLEHDKEWKLGKILVKFPEVISKVTEDLCLHPICEYLYEVSTAFSEFYDNCYCLEKDGKGNIVKVDMGRLLLCEATSLIIHKGLNLLGIEPVQKM